jgi:hypothetical protein
MRKIGAFRPMLRLTLTIPFNTVVALQHDRG